jgi:hypothetical protein
MSASPAGRPDPLHFLEDEVAALKERHLYRRLRVMSSAQGPIVSVDERRLVSLVERLPGPDQPPTDLRRGRGRRA